MDIDVHLLVSADWPRGLLDRALASAKHPALALHVMPYTGVIGRDRAAGYRRGTAPYVTFLDADDELVPEGVLALAAALEGAPDAPAAYGAERRIRADGGSTIHAEERWCPITQLTGGGGPHNAILMRRDAVMPHVAEIANWPIRSDRLLRGLITQSGSWLPVPSAETYRWHLRDGTLRTRPAGDIDRAITQRIAPLLCRSNVHARTLSSTHNVHD